MLIKNCLFEGIFTSMHVFFYDTDGNNNNNDSDNTDD